jgi:uncharacterized repeat protein (TIGR03843 family)
LLTADDGPGAIELAPAARLRLLTRGELELEGRLADASNTTLRALITFDAVTARCVYKPVRGERPLWDFPDGTLAGREVAAYQVSAATGWDIVPPTVLRDGPLGEGACQLWIDEPERFTPTVRFVPARRLPPGWLRIASAQDDNGRPYLLAHADDPGLARMALFDAVVNNADRKGGHVLHPSGGHLYGVDHGVCFHVEDKLRTVLWGFGGRPVPAEDLATLVRLRADLDGVLGDRLCPLISVDEVVATADRLDRLIAEAVFPEPSGERYAMPWPPI